MNKRGRPAKEGSKNKQYKMRMSEKEVAMLEYMADKKGLSKSEIVRDSLRTYYNLLKYQD